MKRNSAYSLRILVDGKALPQYEKDGKTYIAAPPDRDFSIEIGGLEFERTEVVLSVDGLSVMTGKDASSDERGYVITGRGHAIPGFRLNDSAVASFHFGDRKDSYAAQLGKPRNVGVIAAKFFSEQPQHVYFGASGCEESAPGGGLLGGGTRAKSAGHDMGTEFGDRQRHEVGRTTFKRSQEECTFVIEYASEESLRKAGIIPENGPLGGVDPFPGDNTGCQPPAGWCGTGRRNRK